MVYIVGAGPGDPDLITLKAVQSLKLATVVLVDDLVNVAILNHCPQARVVHVGKRGGCESTSQHFINRMMISLAELGQTVVRLKGGDPFLFGRESSRHSISGDFWCDQWYSRAGKPRNTCHT
jgi:uroporphyrin-III C-methyltransferase